MLQLKMLLEVHPGRKGFPASGLLNSLHHTPLNMLKVYFQLPPRSGHQQVEQTSKEITSSEALR